MTATAYLPIIEHPLRDQRGSKRSLSPALNTAYDSAIKIDLVLCQYQKGRTEKDWEGFLEEEA